jgi:hypothetical protein
VRTDCQVANLAASLVVMWIIDAADGATWRAVDWDDKPDHLSVLMRFASTGDGVAVAGVQVERTDGRALTARDMRMVRFPPNWVLFGEAPIRWFQPGAASAVRSRKGPKGDDEARDRMVWNLYRQALEVFPRAPVKWMLPQLGGVSDATARRWIGRARTRAAELGWEDQAPAAGDHDVTARNR